jgi:hypothetical protein
MSSSAPVSDPDRRASTGRREGDPPAPQQDSADGPPVRSQRELVIASLLRCPDPPSGERGATGQQR